MSSSPSQEVMTLRSQMAVLVLAIPFIMGATAMLVSAGAMRSRDELAASCIRVIDSLDGRGGDAGGGNGSLPHFCR